ncbi:MAG TPA: PIN domain-containing protein [Thermoleophilaceae bacterium]|jgi:hypothetical protein|nr:PIN domain-containing protein [Thermoleophilaceae bacterium]
MGDLHSLPHTSQTASSGLELVDVMLADLREALEALFEYSDVRYDDINSRDSGVFVVGWNKWQWTKLPDVAAPAVGTARQAFQRVREFGDRAARTAPDRARELAGLATTLDRLIEQPGGSLPNGAPASTLDLVREYAGEKLDEYHAAIHRLPSAFGEGARLLVVDTSALLDRPDLQAWRLDGGRWTIVLVPQVHAELDERKRDARTRDAAQKVIRQIEEFDRRGDTFAGVPLSGKLMVREIATSPDMGETLPWLRSDVPDDAIIAAALDLMWADLTCGIAVTASDRNVRNKARLAGLGTVHPDEL